MKFYATAKYHNYGYCYQYYAFGGSQGMPDAT